MAQPPPDQNFYHPHPHAHPHAHPHPQLQLPPQFRNPFDLLFDERTGAINYNYIRPYIPNQLQKPDDLSDSLVMRRPRRTRTTFTSAQIAELEQHFLQGRYLTSSRLAELSAKLALGTAQVKIWFKNRRRRHKIQSDQHKDFACDGMPMSPTMPNPSKTEANGSSSSCGSNSSSGSSAGGPLSLQTLSLNGSGGSTPNALTPSPTPTTPTANLMEHYVDPTFNPYYYNNHHVPHHHQAHHGPGALSHPCGSTTSAAGAQYYPPPPRPGSLQYHQHQHQLQHQHQHQHPHSHQQQQHQHQHQQQYHSRNAHQFQMQHKPQMPIKQEPDYNYNNPYYMRMTTAVGGHNAGVAAAACNPGTTTVEPSTAMSPNSEVYEPLTPKNDETSSLCSANNAEVGDDLNETKTKLRVLVATNANGNDDACSNTNAIGSNEGVTGAPAINAMADCTGAFAKYQKMPAPTDANDDNYQCTMDTIMHSYSNHRNTSVSNQQYAYCFN